KALHEASTASAETPLRRLAQVMETACNRLEPLALTRGGTASTAGFLTVAGSEEAGGPPHPLPSSGIGNRDTEKLVVASLWDVILHCQFYRDQRERRDERPDAGRTDRQGAPDRAAAVAGRPRPRRLPRHPRHAEEVRVGPGRRRGRAAPSVPKR